MSDVAVIVPTAVGGERLDRLLDSLEVADAGYRVIVVDNASADPGLGTLERRRPGVEVVRLETNLGFGRAINHAARIARAGTIVLVNDDCVCGPGFVDALTAGIDSRTGTVMAAGVLTDARDPALIDTAGIEVDRTLLAFDYMNGEPVTALARGVADPLGPCGGAAAYDGDAFLELGGFDETLFAFWEDVDLALQMRLAGARCVAATDARAVHEHSGTLGSGSRRKNYLMGFGRGYLLRKYGVLTPTRLPGVLARDAVVCAGQLVVDRNAAGIGGRLAGWRAGERAHHYPGRLIESFRPPGALGTLRDRAARRARLRGFQGPAAGDRDGAGSASEAPTDAPALRTVLVLHVAEASGPARSLEGRMRWLAASGSLDVVVPGPGPAADLYSGFARVHELPYEALMLPGGPGSALSLGPALTRETSRFEALFAEIRPDLVVVASAMLPAAQRAAQRVGSPVILEAAELLTEGRSPLRRVAGRAVIAAAGRRADAVLACSDAVAAQYRRAAGPVLTLHPAIDDSYANGDGPSFRKEHGIPSAAPVVLSVGSVTRMRGQDVLLDAVRQLDGPVTCVLVGEPFPRAQDLDFAQGLRERAGASDGAVRMIPRVGKIADAYAAADVVVNPILDPEAFGRVACEALVAGTAVVSSRVGAVPEVLRDGETALLVEPGDPDELTAAVETLLGDDDLRTRLAERGRVDVLSRFTPELALARFSEALATLGLEEAAAPAAPPSRR
jgi:N-acetylglucosaminyl-diphospho-decaprenol L-rhamnosyltransferase